MMASDDMNILKQHPWYCLTLTISACVMLIFSFFTTLKGDDMLYSYVVGTNYSRSISSISDFFTSVYHGYFIENGRFATVISQFFNGLIGHKWVFDIVNTVVFLLFVKALRLHLCGKERSVAVLLAILLYLLIAVPCPGETLLWISASDNYMWGATFALLLLHYHFSHFEKGETRAFPLISLFFASIIAGEINESISIPVAFGWSAWLVFNRRKLNSAMALSLAGYIVGVCLIMASPAAWERLEGSQTLNGSFATIVEAHAIVLTNNTLHFIAPTVAILIFIVTAIAKRSLKPLLQDLFFWIFVGNMLFIFALGIAYSRVFFFYSLTSFIVVGRFFYARLGQYRKLMKAAAVFMALACIYPAYKGFKDIMDYKIYEEKIINNIISEQSVQSVQPSAWFKASRWVFATRYDSESSSDYSLMYQSYFNKENIVFLREPLYARFKQADIASGGTEEKFQSSNPEFLSTVITFPQQSYSLIPIKKKHISQTSRKMNLYLDAEHNRNNGMHFKSYFPGKLKTQNHLHFFYVEHRGKCYLVVAAIEPDVVKLEIPVKAGNKTLTVTLTRALQH